MKAWSRRKFFLTSLASSAAVGVGELFAVAPAAAASTPAPPAPSGKKPLIISSANGVHALDKGMAILKNGGDTLDAVIAAVTVVEDDPKDANYGARQENLTLLKAMKDQDGRELRVETLPMPAPVYFEEFRLPASYANFYIANKIVLVPTFNDSNDRVALNILAKLFPDREVVGIACRDLVLGLGTLHCMTQQQPSTR